MRHKDTMIREVLMGKTSRRKKKNNFKELLKKYLDIKGLDIVILLSSGAEVELNKNRVLVNNEIVTFDKGNRETRIPLSEIKSVELYAA
jgi:hypothetical protein